MEEPRPSEDAEVPSRIVNSWACQDVQETHDQERRDILHVIAVTPTCIGKNFIYNCISIHEFKQNLPGQFPLWYWPLLLD